jgi:hypothetical protein
MTSSLRRRVVVVSLPSVLLCLVALHHAYRVSRDGLTPWKGGGFGMFSTIDSQAERFVRLSVTIEGGETFAMQIPAEYRRQVDRSPRGLCPSGTIRTYCLGHLAAAVKIPPAHAADLVPLVQALRTSWSGDRTGQRRRVRWR